MLGVAPLHAGFILTADRVALITENELYAPQVRQRTQREAKRATNECMLRDLSEVKIGDPVVHEQHGIGRYLGLQSMDLGEGETEFLTLEYAGGDKLYVPVSNLHLISRYSGAAPEQAPLHTLGSGQWDKAKRKAAAQVRDTAAELLNLYAQRASRQGYAFELKQHDYEAFAETFPFRGDARPGRRHQRHARGPEKRQADGPADLRRRRLRQDRSRAARGVRRGGGRQAGRGAGADDAAGRAALQHVLRPLRRLAGENRRAFALSLRAGAGRVAPRHRRRPHRYRNRHAQAAAGQASSSRTSGWSSSTRSTASACGRKSG